MQKRATTAIARKLGLLPQNSMAATQLYETFSNSRKKTCHIIASGWSVRESIKRIDLSSSFIIGFNFCAFADLPFDAYFIELASSDREPLSRIQNGLVCDYAAHRISNVFIKNIWEGKIQPEYVERYYGQAYRYINDIYLSLSRPRSNVVGNWDLARRLLEYDPTFVRQLHTTTLTSIAIAKHIGFSKIVVHGLDFSGLHFFLEDDFFCDTEYLFELRKWFEKFHTPNDNAPHAAAQQARPMLPILARLLLDENVVLYTAVSDSPSSAYLDVYYS